MNIACSRHLVNSVDAGMENEWKRAMGLGWERAKGSPTFSPRSTSFMSSFLLAPTNQQPGTGQGDQYWSLDPALMHPLGPQSLALQLPQFIYFFTCPSFFSTHVTAGQYTNNKNLLGEVLPVLSLIKEITHTNT